MSTYNRKIVLDTETTGINSSGAIYLNHRIIEIGAVEIINRRITKNFFHIYLNPNRSIDKKAYKIHGISNKFLADKPNFSNIYIKFIKYIKNSQLIIHNSKFDLSFLNYELKLLNKNIPEISHYCTILDTLKLSRKIFPGKKNSLEALCKRYKIYYHRKLHSAILDAKLLARVYLLMTTHQKSIFSIENFSNIISDNKTNVSLNKKFFIKYANEKEKHVHMQYLKYMKKKGNCLWMHKLK